MDIGELLSYKPSATPKRPLNEDTPRQTNRDDYERKQKVRKIEKLQEIEKSHSHCNEPTISLDNEIKQEPELTGEYIDEILNNDIEEGEIFDEYALKKMLLQFEKRSLKNREMRIKFTDNPEKFMDSELELHEGIQELHAVATTPDLYPVLVQMHAVDSLLDMLTHENADISVAVVDLLQELTDVDIMNESEEGANNLLSALFEKDICALLVQNLERLDETVREESEGVHKTLGIFENLIEFVPEKVTEIGKNGLVQWLLKRLKAKIPFESNKLYVSEILSMILQESEENRKLFGELDGIDVLLQQLAFYKKRDPSSAEEQEMMENLFDCLCATLVSKDNRDKFLKGEGLQLMNLMLREKKKSSNGSLKVLDHSMSGQHGADNCNKYIDILGLRVLFPLFMKTPKMGKKRTLSEEEHEEHVVSIISSMLRHCRGNQRQRLFAKFTENDHEKVDRLMELHFKYLEKVDLVEREVEKLTKDAEISEEDFENEIYLKRLENGLYTLQLIDFIILEVCTNGAPTIKQRALQILNLRGGALKTIRQIMREYAGNLGDKDDTADWLEEERQHVLQLIDKF